MPCRGSSLPFQLSTVDCQPLHPSHCSPHASAPEFGSSKQLHLARSRVAIQWFRGALMPDYTAEHARAGINAKLPALETWPNQFPGYIITTRFPEYSSVCPKTGLPDFGTITIQYMPKKDCIELKALKMYLLAYRSLGIFYENAVNKILRDIVEAVRPEWCVVRGEFTPRGGLTTSIFARWPKINMKSKRGRKGRPRRNSLRRA